MEIAQAQDQVKLYLSQNSSAFKRRKKIIAAAVVVVLAGGVGFGLWSVFAGITEHYLTPGGGLTRTPPPNVPAVDTSTWNFQDVGVFVGYGQSNSDCCGQPSSISFSGKEIYQFATDNKTYPYLEPMSGAYCVGGCVYGDLGDELIQSSKYSKTIFATTGMPGASLTMLTSSQNVWYGNLVQTYNALYKHFKKVDGILYHQGESDNVILNPTGRSNYNSTFRLLVENLQRDLNDPNFTIYLSRATLCAGPVDAQLSAIQTNLAQKLQNVEPGPVTDMLGFNWRFDNCHWSAAGLKKVATMWNDLL